MANTTFTGPVISTNGFQGDTTGDVTGDVTGNVTGYIILPEADPAVAGALWNDNGTITVSAG
jgi:hypothetical protein